MQYMNVLPNARLACPGLRSDKLCHVLMCYLQYLAWSQIRYAMYERSTWPGLAYPGLRSVVIATGTVMLLYIYLMILLAET